MEGFFLLLFCGAFAFIGSFVWGSIVDGTIRREPSDWLGYTYLSALVMLIGYGSKYLDEFRFRPYRASLVTVVAVLLLGWSAVFLWRKAAKWDENFRKGKPSHRHK